MTIHSINKKTIKEINNDELIKEMSNKLNAIYKLYGELYELEEEFIDRIRARTLPKEKTPLNADYDVIIKYYGNRLIDYNKLKRDYPEMYALGLVSTFSKDELLKTVDRKTALAIIRDVSIRNPKYALRYERKRLSKDVKNSTRK